MKKRILPLLLVIAVFLSCSASVLATGSSGNNLVADYAGVLTDSELSRLNTQAESASAEFGCDVAIVVVNNTEGYEISYYAGLVYDSLGYGYGPDGSIIMLLVSMGDREYFIWAYGYGNTAFTDYGKARLEEAFLPALSNGDYYSSFSSFISTCETYLKHARGGTPVDVGNDQVAESSSPNIFLIVVLPIIVALLYCIGALRKMKTAVPQRAARNYIPEGGFNLTGKQDVFVNRTETREKINTNTSSSSGGTTVNSNGSSSRKGRF